MKIKVLDHHIDDGYAACIAERSKDIAKPISTVCAVSQALMEQFPGADLISTGHSEAVVRHHDKQQNFRLTQSDGEDSRWFVTQFDSWVNGAAPRPGTVELELEEIPLRSSSVKLL